MLHDPLSHHTPHRPDAISSVAQAQALVAIHCAVAQRQRAIALAVALCTASAIVGSLLAIVLLSGPPRMMTVTNYVATKDLFRALIRAKRGLAPAGRPVDHSARECSRAVPLRAPPVEPPPLRR